MRMIGTNDEYTSCDCCGRTNLKRTVILETEDGAEVRYGVDCAATALRRSGSNVSVKGLNLRADALAWVRKMLPLHPADQVAATAYNRFGFPTEVKNGK